MFHGYSYIANLLKSVHKYFFYHCDLLIYIWDIATVLLVKNLSEWVFHQQHCSYVPNIDQEIEKANAFGN